MSTPEPWVLYILRCGDGSFYTGITNNLDRRLSQHSQGTASRYTRSRLPITLVYQEPCKGKSAALKREWSVKALTRKQKEALIVSPRKRQKNKRSVEA